MSINEKKIIAELAKSVSRETLMDAVKTASESVQFNDMCDIEKWEYFRNNYDVSKTAFESPEMAEKIASLAEGAAKELDIAKIADVTSDIVIHKLEKFFAQKEASQMQARKPTANSSLNNLFNS